MTGQITCKGPVFIMFMGLPGAGKSTLRKEMPPSFLQLSTDDIIENVAKWQGRTYSEAFSDEIGPASETVNLAFAQAMKDGTSVIWDQTNLTAKKRKKVLAHVPKGYCKILIEVVCDEDTRRARVKAREPEKTIPTHIDLSMLRSREEPSYDEGWDEIWVRRT